MHRTGHRLVVEVTEATPKPDMVLDRIPCNILASQEAEIVRTTVLDGMLMHKVGDYVFAGDLLISGVTTDDTGRTVLHHAMGTIIGKYKEEVSFECEYTLTESVPTGRKYESRVLHILSLDVPIFSGKSKFESAVCERREKPVNFFGAQLPMDMFLMGNSREQHILPILYMIDDPEKWNDLAELRKSLPGLGESVSEEFIRKEIDTAEESISKATEFRTKYCNLKQSVSTCWFRAEDIERMFGWRKPLEEIRNKYCVGGIDLSQSVDLTCGIVITEIDGILWTHAHFWLPNKRLEEATKRDNIPYEIFIRKGFLSLSGEEFINNDDVILWFMDLVKTWKIFPLQIGFDRWSAQDMVQKMQQKLFHMDSVTQGFNLSSVEDTLEGMLREGRIRDMDDNDLLKIHLADAAQQMESNTEQAHPRKKLVKLTKNAHVDGVAAMLDAMAMRQFKWAELGKRLMNGGG